MNELINYLIIVKIMYGHSLFPYTIGMLALLQKERSQTIGNDDNINKTKESMSDC